MICGCKIKYNVVTENSLLLERMTIKRILAKKLKLKCKGSQTKLAAWSLKQESSQRHVRAQRSKQACGGKLM